MKLELVFWCLIDTDAKFGWNVLGIKVENNPEDWKCVF